MIAWYTFMHALRHNINVGRTRTDRHEHRATSRRAYALYMRYAIKIGLIMNRWTSRRMEIDRELRTERLTWQVHGSSASRQCGCSFTIATADDRESKMCNNATDRQTDRHTHAHRQTDTEAERVCNLDTVDRRHKLRNSASARHITSLTTRPSHIQSMTYWCSRRHLQSDSMVQFSHSRWRVQYRNSLSHTCNEKPNGDSNKKSLNVVNNEEVSRFRFCFLFYRPGAQFTKNLRKNPEFIISFS